MEVKGLKYISPFEILAGARRFRAATAAGINALPVRVIQATDAEALEIIVLENLQREDVHPLEEADGYRALLERSGYDVAAIAAKVGKSESFIYQRLKLLDLIPAAQKAFLAGEITAGHAVLIARLQPNDQKDALDASFDEEWTGTGRIRVLGGVRSLGLYIEREIHLDLGKVPFDTNDATLLPKAGACTTCPKRTGFSPALFPDIKHKDTCTDRGCFHAKMAAHVERKKVEFKEQGEKLVEISESYQTDKGSKALGRSRYNLAPASGKNTCEHVVKGIMVDGRELGKVLTVCTNEKCGKHRRGGGYNGHAAPKPSAAEREKRHQENLKQRRKAEIVRRSFLAISAEAPEKLSHAELRAVVAGYLEEMQQNTLVAICGAYGIEVITEKRSGYTQRDPKKGLNAWLDTLTELELTKFLVTLPAARGLEFSPWNTEWMKEIRSTAVRWKVDLAAVEKAVDAEFREKEQRRKERLKAAEKKAQRAKPAKGKPSTGVAAKDAKKSGAKKSKVRRGTRVQTSAKKSAGGAEASA